MQATLQRTHSTREMERRYHRMQRKSRIAPSLTAPQKVVIRPEAGATPEEELYLLGAIEALRLRHDNLKIVYIAENREIEPLLFRRWFLDSAIARSTYDDPDAVFEHYTKDDFGITVGEPDPEAAAKTEEEIYEREYQRKVAEIRAQQKAAQDAGVKDLVLPEPPHQFIPCWHKTNGYYWLLCEELGLAPDVPKEPIAPFGGDIPENIRKHIHRLLHKEYISRRPFVLYDFEGEASALPLMAMLAEALPDLELVSLAEVEKAAGTGVDVLLALCLHHQCRYVVAPVGALSCAAWAAGVPNLLSVYSGANPQWDGPHPENLFTLSRDRFSDEQMPEALRQALSFLTARAQRKRAA